MKRMKLYRSRLAAVFALLVFTLACLSVARVVFAAGADLTVTKTASAPTITVGQPVTFTMVVRNVGTVTATNVVLTDPLPALASSGWATASCTGPIAGCVLGIQYVGTTLSVTVVKISPSTIVTVTTVMTSAVAGNMVNTAYVSSNPADDVAANNTASASVAVNPSSAITDVVVTKSVSPMTTIVGKPVTYTLVARYAAGITTTNVILTDPLPLAATLGPATAECAGPTTCTLGLTFVGRTLIVTATQILPDTAFTVTTVVTPTQTGLLANTAYVSSQPTDDNATNNAANVTVLVGGFFGYLPVTLRQVPTMQTQ